MMIMKGGTVLVVAVVFIIIIAIVYLYYNGYMTGGEIQNWVNASQELVTP